VQPFKGKKLLGAIYGQQCISNTTNRVAMEKFCKQQRLLNGDAEFIGVGDSCTNSPSFKPCRPQAMLQCKPSLTGGSLTFMHAISPVGGLRATAYLEAYLVPSDLLQPRLLAMSFLFRHQWSLFGNDAYILGSSCEESVPLHVTCYVYQNLHFHLPCGQSESAYKPLYRLQESKSHTSSPIRNR